MHRYAKLHLKDMNLPSELKTEIKAIRKAALEHVPSPPIDTAGPFQVPFRALFDPVTP